MLTLMQFVTFDNIVYIYTPLVKEDWRLIAFFTTVIMVVGIVLMNLVLTRSTRKPPPKTISRAETKG